MSQETCVFVDSFSTVVNNSSIFKNHPNSNFEEVVTHFNQIFEYAILSLLLVNYIYYTTTYFYYIFLFYFETVEKVSLKDVGGVVCVLCVCVYIYI